ncbi:MAG TPA: exosortase system-associated protein, TIGR04073 family [bacterium]
MRMRQVMIAAVMVMAISFTPLAHAQDPINKAGRGAVNLLTGWLEIFKQVHMGKQDPNPFQGLGMGLVRGTSLTVIRTGTGAYELLTFPVAYPNGFASPYPGMELPDYAWQPVPRAISHDPGVE